MKSHANYIMSELVVDTSIKLGASTKQKFSQRHPKC